MLSENKLESLEATLVRNYDQLTDSAVSILCRATSVATYSVHRQGTTLGAAKGCFLLTVSELRSQVIQFFLQSEIIRTK